MVEISVVIPVYNSCKFLGECLDSIVNQTFKDIEIICVAGGLSCNSLKVLNKYASRDNRFIVIDQGNCGHAVAFNRGIDVAKGKYLFLMDFDGILDLNALEYTYKIAEEKDVDFEIFQAVNYFADKNELAEAKNYSMDEFADFVENRVFNWRDIKDFVFKINAAFWAKLYNREFIIKNDIRFHEGLIFDEEIFFFDALFASERITFCRKQLFRKCLYSSHSITPRGVEFLDYITISDLIWDIFRKYGVFEEFKEKLFEKKVDAINWAYNEISGEFKQKYFDKMKGDYVQLAGDEEFFDDFLNNLNDEHKMILDSVLESEVYTEFDLRLEHKLLLHKNDELKTKECLELRKNKQIRNKCHAINNQIKNLKEENENLILINKQLTDKINKLA